MTLTKKKMVREIGRRTGLPNREVQEVVEALIDVWTETLVKGEKIEVQDFLVLEVRLVDRGENTGVLHNENSAPRHIKRVFLRLSKRIKLLLKT